MKAFRIIDKQTAQIELSQGYWAVVDSEDLDRLVPFRWTVLRSKGRIYAKTRIDGRTVYMHRFIANAPCDRRFVIDHVDSNGLNNCRQNLRIATWAENSRNSRGAFRTRISATRGVTRRKHSERPWRAYIYEGHKFRHLGYFCTEREATEARLRAEKELFGEFAFQCRIAA